MKYGVFIGRFQPFHNGHLAVVNDALSKVDKLIIVIGSANAARNVKNPWTAAERQSMLHACILATGHTDRVEYVHINDYTYNDNMWVSQVQNKIDQLVPEDADVTLFGPDKDRTTYYLSLFPQWKRSVIEWQTANPNVDLCATHIRNFYLSGDLYSVLKSVPDPVYQLLRHNMQLPQYSSLKDEFGHVQSYREAWSKAPYPPTFVTTDAVVIKSGHVLVVRRKCQPGKGLLALPGGFLNQHERIEDGCIRELKEETGIPLSVEELRNSIVDQRVFDHPDRSLRGRTITHAFAFNLGSGKLPRVKGNDDAEKALWIPIGEVSARGNEFYEDHCSIVAWFANRF